MRTAGASNAQIYRKGSKIHKLGSGQHIDFEKKAYVLMSKLSFVNPFIVRGKGTKKGLITNYKNGPHLNDIINELNPKELKDVIWQLKWCLYIFEIIGFQHNDLHLNNIIVDLQPFTGCFINLQGKKYYKQFSLRVWIFDFDRAIKVARPKLRTPFDAQIKHPGLNRNHGWAHQTSQFKKGMNAYKVFSHISKAHYLPITFLAKKKQNTSAHTKTEKIVDQYYLLKQPLTNKETRQLLNLGKSSPCKTGSVYDARKLFF